jgi:ribose transport system permease protein
MNDQAANSAEKPQDSAANPATAGDDRSRLRIDEVTIQVMVMCALLVGLVALTGCWDSKFFTPFNLRTVLRDVAIWSLFALGQAVVIIAGGIDLSVGSLFVS